MGEHSGGVMPSQANRHPSIFDRFADRANTFVSRAWFFALCVLMVLLWLPTYFLVDTIDTWQLIINTLTTIVTFLLVALLQNTQTRSDEATQQKLNAIADALSDLMSRPSHERERLAGDARELRLAVGLEKEEGS
ncbi:low affinity Fe/Cu permease [Crossiella equi]|uniref:Low affinity Fe/Cu permease n=1 Tax=Crossiella equi TaxID=130796 RepID=A0ABS5A4V7_9PSEU|nr:low affinity iron permease family protein [Crossiella equi]MBP2471619.1 low affinity Fe/Cu permease [Crossiella equi]